MRGLNDTPEHMLACEYCIHWNAGNPHLSRQDNGSPAQSAQCLNFEEGPCAETRLSPFIYTMSHDFCAAFALDPECADNYAQCQSTYASLREAAAL